MKKRKTSSRILNISTLSLSPWQALIGRGVRHHKSYTLSQVPAEQACNFFEIANYKSWGALTREELIARDGDGTLPAASRDTANQPAVYVLYSSGPK